MTALAVRHTDGWSVPRMERVSGETHKSPLTDFVVCFVISGVKSFFVMKKHFFMTKIILFYYVTFCFFQGSQRRLAYLQLVQNVEICRPLQLYLLKKSCKIVNMQ